MGKDPEVDARWTADLHPACRARCRPGGQLHAARAGRRPGCAMSSSTVRPRFSRACSSCRHRDTCPGISPSSCVDDGTVVVAGQSHDAATAFSADALALRAAHEGYASPLPLTPEWIDRLQRLDRAESSSPTTTPSGSSDPTRPVVASGSLPGHRDPNAVTDCRTRRGHRSARFPRCVTKKVGDHPSVDRLRSGPEDAR